MGTRGFSFAEGEYYHIYSRGADRRDIFLDEADKQRFIKLLFVANGTHPFVFRDFPKSIHYTDFDKGASITSIGAYCLMPNHFHLLLKETNEDGISKFMRKVLTSYSSYFNKKYSRSGVLFEGVFKAKHLDTDEYLKYIFAYIHLNPVKLIDPYWKEKGVLSTLDAEKHINEYVYSSCIDYLGKNRVENKLLDKKVFPEYFSDFKEYKDFITEWLTFNSNLTT